MYIATLASTANNNYSYGIQIDHGEDVGILVTGIRVRSTTAAAINTALDMSDAEIATAIHIGDNSFKTTSTTILAGDFDDLFGSGNHQVDGSLDLDGGTTHTMLTADGTPDVSAGSNWHTFENNQYITRFDGTNDAGKVLIYHIDHSGVSFACGGNFYCGSTRAETMYTAVGDTVTWVRGLSYWRLVSSTAGYYEQSATVTWVGDEIATGTKLNAYFVPGNGNAKGTSIHCIAEGADADLAARLVECNGGMTSCTTTGGDVAVANDGVLYSDTTLQDDDTNAAGRWYTFEITAITVTPDTLTCAVQYTMF